MIVMSDECDVLCCCEVCVLTAAIVQWVDQLPATQVTGEGILERVHIGIFFVLYISDLIKCLYKKSCKSLFYCLIFKIT